MLVGVAQVFLQLLVLEQRLVRRFAVGQPVIGAPARVEGGADIVTQLGVLDHALNVWVGLLEVGHIRGAERHRVCRLGRSLLL